MRESVYLLIQFKTLFIYGIVRQWYCINRLVKGCKTGNGVNEDVTGVLLELLDVKSATATRFKECVAATHSLAFKTSRPTRRLFCLCVNDHFRFLRVLRILK